MAAKSKRVNRGIAAGKSVKVDMDCYERLKEIAKEERRSISGQIAYLLDFYRAAESKSA